MTWFSGRPSSPATSLEYHHPSKDVTVDNLLRNWTKLTSKEISESNSTTALEVTEGSGNKGKNRLMPAHIGYSRRHDRQQQQQAEQGTPDQGRCQEEQKRYTRRGQSGPGGVDQMDPGRVPET